MSAATLPYSSHSMASPMRFSARLDNTWITAPADVVRSFYPRPLLHRRKQELS